MPVTHTPNTDLSKFPEGVGTYTKGLQHGADGIVDATAFKQFLKACGITFQNHPPQDSDIANFEDSAIVLGPDVKLNGPQGAFAKQLAGKQSEDFGDNVVATPVDLDSPEYWVELIELYWASLLRDVPFSEYTTNATAKAAAEELTGFSLAGHYSGPVDAKGRVTPDLLFRGGSGKPSKSGKDLFFGEREGPYLSQLCIQPTMLGAIPIDQKIRTFVPGEDFMTDFKDFIAVQNGQSTDRVLCFDPQRRFMRTGRDTAAYTHSDELYQAYLVAFLACNAAGITPTNNKNTKYFNYKNEKPFGTFGGPDITGTIGAVARAAINAVWYQKWRVHLRHRPEFGGGLVELWSTGKLAKSIKDKFAKTNNIATITNSTALNLSRLINNSSLLSQAFPEGSPTHPAYPTGHGVVAGACITVLKFFLDGDARFEHPVMPSSDGLKLEPYTGAKLTLNGELHKLAHNISFGHGIHAGIHWRSDTDSSLLLGEAVAVAYLHGLEKTFKEPFDFAIKLMDGKTLEPFRNP